MYSKSEQNSIVLAKTVESAIERVNRRHYLGSSNHKTNSCGGLSGYYRNVASTVYNSFRDPNGMITPLFYIYLLDACVTHTGAGNCGELSAALYLELFLSDLTLEQKKQVEFRSYLTNDEHKQNSYVLVNSTVCDIWDRKKYKKSRIKAETHVNERFHKIEAALDPTISQEHIKLMRAALLAKFSTLFDEEIAKERKNNIMYVTLDSSDSSDYALWASDAFPYLFNKFKETVDAPYFLENRETASIIQGKILKDYVYLIEELRQDIPVTSPNALLHSRKIKSPHEEIAKALRCFIPNNLFMDFVLAISYQNSNPQKALELLLKLQANLNQNSRDKVELSIVARVSKLIVELKGNSKFIISAATTPVQITNDAEETKEGEDADHVEDSTSTKDVEYSKELNLHHLFARTQNIESTQPHLTGVNTNSYG